MPIVIMLLSAFAIIALVKYGLVPGIDRLSAALGWSLKARGKATGYATSVPELVALVAAGLSGVWEAGLWNIASSNLINMSLAAIAVLVFKRGGDLIDRRFAKELSFAGLGILAPLVLMQANADTHWGVIPVLLVLFGVYLMLDKGDGEIPDGQPAAGEVSAVSGFAMIAVSLGLIVVVGDFLGTATRDVVQIMGVPAIAGLILGVVTSLQAVTFFTVFSDKRASGGEDKAQIQELPDNLMASNIPALASSPDRSGDLPAGTAAW